MATLRIDLQDGFRDDSVVVSVDGAEVLRRDGVSTNLVLSRADSAEVTVPEGESVVRVDVPTQALSAERPLRAEGNVFLTVNVLDGRLDVQAPAEEPRYL
jgi:hypothetical protein